MSGKRFSMITYMHERRTEEAVVGWGRYPTLQAAGASDLSDSVVERTNEVRGNGLTEFVTHIGIEMQVVLGKRKIVRIVEYRYENECVFVTDLALYDNSTGKWTFPGKLSLHASRKIRKADRVQHSLLTEHGFIENEGKEGGFEP